MTNALDPMMPESLKQPALKSPKAAQIEPIVSFLDNDRRFLRLTQIGASLYPVKNIKS